MAKTERRRARPARGPGGGGPVAPPGEKPKNLKKTMLGLWRSLGKYRIAIIFVVIFAIAGTVFSIVGPKILGNATTEIFNGLIGKISNTGGIDFAKIAGILLTLLALYALSSIFSLLEGLIMTNIAQGVTYKMRNDISQKLNKLPMDVYDTRQTGEILSIITNDIDTISTTLNQSATQIIYSATTIIGVLIMMFSINWQMTLVALLIIPISFVFVSVIVKMSHKYFKQQQDYLGHVNGQIEENFSALNIVQAFNHEKRTIDEFESDNETLYTASWKSQFLSSVMMPTMNFVSNLGYVAISILGGYFAISGSIAVGDIQAFIQYVRNFTQPIMQIAQVSNLLQSMAAASERVFTFLDLEEESQTAENHATITVTEKDKSGKISTFKRNVLPSDISGGVTFDHVKFGYNPEKIIIKDFSSKVTTGQRVAIVGPTGAGKTTLVKLLLRFYDVNGGTIYVDNYNIKDFDRQELRELFGMVLQDTWLFNGTIMENIRYGRLDATDEEVIAAAKAAHVHNFVRTLPDGYNMVLNEEISNISQGQKQLITIARTILADPKILILDEATSSVDTRTEIRIQKAMNNLMKNRTSFVIAHRLSTIKDSDIILVLSDGDIVEQGTHDELISLNGFYAQLYNSQFESA